jgi:hypothetical protein
MKISTIISLRKKQAFEFTASAAYDQNVARIGQFSFSTRASTTTWNYEDAYTAETSTSVVSPGD